MKENTTDRPTTEHFDPFDPGSLLSSDSVAWEGVAETSSAKFCGNVPIRGIERTTGRNVAYPVRCDTLFHQPCAEAKIMGKLRLLSFAAHKSPTWHFAVVETSNLARNILADRRYHLAKKLDRPVRYMRVDRVGGTTFILASDPLTGRKEPTAFYPTDDLLRLAAEALSLPGVLRIQTSRWGLDDNDDADDDVVCLGFVGDARYLFVERHRHPRGHRRTTCRPHRRLPRSRRQHPPLSSRLRRMPGE